MINGIGFGSYAGYSGYSSVPSRGNTMPASERPVSAGNPIPSVQPSSSAAVTPAPVRPVPGGGAARVQSGTNSDQSGISPYAVTNEDEAREAGLSEGQIRGLKKAGQIECATCAGRMYQDGSDENVSFKSAAHVSPTAAGAAVRSHEGEHVSNAYKKAAMNNGKVMRASVSIHMAICPECGRSYVSGGTTSTSIKYYNENSQMAAHQKSFDEAAGIKGRKVDVQA